MSTKNLARTVIEGGRYFHNAWFRRFSSQVERVRVREHLRALCRDPDTWDATVLPKRQPVPKYFRDNLAPAYRFLSSRAGIPWNESYSLLRRRFDDRTTAGRHILFDHLLDSIEYVGEDHHPDRNSRWGRFTVDEDGVLQKVNRARRKRRRAAFSLSCRKAGIGLRSGLFWFAPRGGGAPPPPPPPPAVVLPGGKPPDPQRRFARSARARIRSRGSAWAARSRTGVLWCSEHRERRTIQTFPRPADQFVVRVHLGSWRAIVTNR